MTWKDKLEIGLKDDAPYRRDNLPDRQKRPKGPSRQLTDEDRSPEEPGARDAARLAARIDKQKAEHADRRTGPAPAKPRARRAAKSGI